MSTVFVVEHEKIETPYAFTKLSDGVFYRFEDSRYGKTEHVAFTAGGEAVFPEDFSNKRAYLEKVKSQGKGWKKFSENYRLRDETVSLIKSLGPGTVFYLIDITEIEEKFCGGYVNIPLKDLSTRFLLRYEDRYKVC